MSPAQIQFYTIVVGIILTAFISWQWCRSHYKHQPYPWTGIQRDCPHLVISMPNIRHREHWIVILDRYSGDPVLIFVPHELSGELQPLDFIEVRYHYKRGLTVIILNKNDLLVELEEIMNIYGPYSFQANYFIRKYKEVEDFEELANTAQELKKDFRRRRNGGKM